MKQLKNILVFSLVCTLACNVATGSLQIGAATSEMQREASSFLLRTDHTQSGDARVFPAIKFKCRGSLEGLLFVAEKGQGNGSDITFQAWAMVNSTNTSFTGRLRNKQTIQLADSTLLLDRDDIALYRASFKGGLQFEVGDVLGIEQGPQSGDSGLQYIYDWGPLNYVFSYRVNDTSVFQNGLAIINDYPLVAVVTSDAGCFEGFLSESYLRDFLAKNFNSKVVVPFLGSASTTPLLQFNSTGSITAWKVEGVEREDMLQLQIWRLVNSTGGEKVYREVTDSSMKPRSQNYQPECELYVVEQELVFQENDILAIDTLVKVFLGRAVVSTIESGSGQGSTSGSGTPNQTCDNSVPSNAAKLTLSIEPDSADGSFVDPNAIIQPVITNVSYNRSTTIKFSSVVVVPSYRINRSGMLRRWVFTVDESLRPPTSAPQLQVWRKTPNPQHDTYIRIASTSATNRITRSSVLGAYELLLDPPVQVKAGDILGLLQAAQGDGQAKVVVLAGTGPSVIELTPAVGSSLNESVREFPQQTKSALPLIAALVSESGTPTPVVTVSPTPTPVVTVSPTEDDDPVLGRTAGILIGVFIGAVVIAAGLLVIFIICCCLVVREKRYTKAQKNGVSKNMTPISVNNYAQRVGEQPSVVVQQNTNFKVPVSRDEGATSGLSGTSGEALVPPANMNVQYNHSALTEHKGVTTIYTTSDAESDKINTNSNFIGETDSLLDNGDTATELNELKFE